MTKFPDLLREFGITPQAFASPPERVRCYLPIGHVIGQYVFTCVLSSLGIGLGVLCMLARAFPENVGFGALPVVACGFIVYVATRNDYEWIELDSQTLRAKHLYTRRVVERSVGEVKDLLTQTFQARTATTMITEAWLGRIRRVKLQFYDGRTPLLISWADPKMKNATQLLDGIIYRMTEKAELGAEVINFRGTPLLRRIYRQGLE